MIGVGLFLLFVVAIGGYAFFYVRGSKSKWMAAENCLIAAKMYSELVEEDKLKINKIVLRKAPAYGLKQERNELTQLLKGDVFLRSHCYARVFSETGVLPGFYLKRWHRLEVTDPSVTLSEKDREFKFTLAKLNKEIGQTLSMDVGPFVVS